MSIRETIRSAGRNLNTIILTASEKDGSVETREAEPYSFKIKGDKELFFCFDIAKGEIRSFYPENIIEVEETNNSFEPQ